MSDIQLLEERIGYQFKDQTLLMRALTHRSFCKENSGRSSKALHNETLEFLGDAVLSLVVADALFNTNPNGNEGKMTKLRAAFVCQDHLSLGAKRLHLGEMMRVAKAMRNSGPIELPSVLSDVVEAIIGAVYIDGGIEAAKESVFKILGPLPNKLVDTEKDSKTVLQELLQKAFSVTPSYELVSNVGPKHEPKFIVSVAALDKVWGTGEGLSKKKAEQEAAKRALDSLGFFPSESK